MIPVFLQDDLKKRLVSLFEGQFFENPDQQRVPLKVFKQHLPIMDSSEEEAEADDLSLYPYILVKLQQGIQDSWDSPLKVSVDLVIGVFNENPDRKGYQDVIGILQRIQADFLSEPNMERQFGLSSPPNWMIHDEDLHPFYFGGMELHFEQGINIIRKDVNRLL